MNIITSFFRDGSRLPAWAAAMGCLVLLILPLAAQDDPGWDQFHPAPLVPVLMGPGNAAAAPAAARVVRSGVGLTNEADEITTEISELAAGLGNDLERIFSWVREHIRFTHYYGCHKGATLTLYERSGNDVDQAALLGALLKAAGYTVRYNAGTSFTADAKWSDYFGVEVGAYAGDGVEAGSVVWRTLVASGGLLALSGHSETHEWGLRRFWVEVQVGGQWKRFDASAKKTVFVSPQADVALRSGYSLSALQSAAGGTVVTHGISGVSQTAVENELKARAQVLQTHVQTTQMNLSAVEAFGGRGVEKFQPVDPDNLTAEECFPFEVPGWGERPLGNDGAALLPAELLSTLRIQLSASTGGAWTLDHTVRIPALAGRRLTLEFDGAGAAGQAVLRLDDTVIATESVPLAAGTSCLVRTTILHAGAANQGARDALYARSGRYALVYAQDAGEHLLRARMGRLARYRESGKTDTDREVVVETLNVMGLSWMRQTELQSQALQRASDVVRLSNHRFGRVAQESHFYIDVGLDHGAVCRRWASQGAGLPRDFLRAWAPLGSAMEHGVLAQMQPGADGVSTVRAVALNNAAANPVTYLATRQGGVTNWAAVRPLLTGYSAAQLNSIEAVMNSASTVGAYALMPGNGSIVRNNWTGAGYLFERQLDAFSSSHGMIISGGLNGGYSTNYGSVTSTRPTTQYYSAAKAPTPSVTLTQAFRNMAGDPVNLSTGYMLTSGPSLSLGGGGLPRGLALSVDYDGMRRGETAAGLGFGWDHSLNARLSRSSDYENTFGSPAAGTAVQAARLALGAHALLDVSRNLSTARDWVLAQLTAQWMADALVDNTVTVALNGTAYQFTKSADGSGWLSPPGSTLSFSPAAANTSGKDEVRERHGNTYRFDTEGKLLEVEDPWAKKAALTYDATTKKLTKVTDAYGRFFDLVWDANGRLDYVSDPQSSPARTLDLDYDAGGHLITITDPEGKSDRFEYDAEHRLIKQRDHDSRLITWNTQFDSQHRVLEQKGMGLDAQVWKFSYAPGEVRVTDPANATTIHCYDERGRPCVKIDPLGHREKAEFDGENHTLVRHTPLGRKTLQSFDAKHNPLTTTASSGGSTPALSSTQSTYDAQNRLKTTTDPLGHVITYGYHGDADGVSDPDAKHLPTRVYHTVSGQLEETKTTYNAAGNVETVTDAAGNLTSFEYDAFDRLTYTRLPGPGSLYTQVMSYTAAGDPHQVKDARGVITTHSYNKRREPAGTVTTATTVDSATQSIDPVTEYDNNRHAFKAINPLGRFTTSTFSPTGKLLTTRHSALPGVDLVSNTYDERDLLWKVTNVLSQQSTLTYDAASRLTDAGDHLERNVHTEQDDDDRPLTTRNRLAKTTTTGYLDAERKSTTTNPLNQVWTLQTDAAGRLWKRTNARSKTWEHSYDEAGRLKSTLSPEGRITSATYNTRGLLETATEPSLQSTTLTYDARGRLDDVTGADYTLDHAYDANGNLLTLTEITTSLGSRSVTRTYDEIGRVKTYTNSEGETLKYVWDENSNLRFLEYPDASRVEYQYDARDRLQYVKEAGVTMAEFVWTDANQLKKVIRANGTIRELFYDTANRLERIEERGPNGKLFFYQRAAFDDDDRMTKRLVLPHASAWQEPQDAAVFDGDNWMTSFNGTTLNHDADGNLLAAPTRAISSSVDGSTTFAWDARNRITSATTGTDARFYTYSPDGHLTHLRTGSATAAVGTRLSVNPHGSGGLSQVLLRTDLDTNAKTKVIHGLGVLYEKRPDGSVRWYHHDHLGNTMALTDGAGAVTGRAAYSPYGVCHSSTGDIQSTPFLYNGRFGVLTEAASGCLHMRARWYNPRIRRFLSSDPAGFDGGWNMFAYADGNPMAMVDPFGLGAKSSQSSGYWRTTYTSDPQLNRLLDWGRGVADRNDSFAASQYRTGTTSAAEVNRYFPPPPRKDMMVMEATLWTLALIEPTPLGEAAMMGRAGTRAAVSGGTRAGVSAAKEVTYVQMEFSFARGASIQTPGLTTAGETFVRVGAAPQNLKFGSTSLNGVQPGAYAFPEATFNAIGQNPAALKNFGDLPGAAPGYFRVLSPPAGTPIQRGIVPGGEFGGAGGVEEVIFPKGF